MRSSKRALVGLRYPGCVHPQGCCASAAVAQAAGHCAEVYARRDELCGVVVAQVVQCCVDAQAGCQAVAALRDRVCYQGCWWLFVSFFFREVRRPYALSSPSGPRRRGRRRHASVRIRTASAADGGDGFSLGGAGGSDGPVGLTATHFQRTARSKAPDRIQWICRTVDGASGLQTCLRQRSVALAVPLGGRRVAGGRRSVAGSGGARRRRSPAFRRRPGRPGASPGVAALVDLVEQTGPYLLASAAARGRAGRFRQVVPPARQKVAAGVNADPVCAAWRPVDEPSLPLRDSHDTGCWCHGCLISDLGSCVAFTGVPWSFSVG